MQTTRWLLAVAISLVTGSAARAQVVQMQMTVTGAEMH
jgi:hypothetical protein